MDHGTYHGWHYEHHYATGVSYAWREGRDEISADGDDHDHAICRMIDEQPTDRELAEAAPVELPEGKLMGMIDKNCECCGKPMKVRSADVKRGWGRFCSKSCKAKRQEQRTGQYHNAAYRAGGDRIGDGYDEDATFSPSMWNEDTQ